MQDSLIWDYKNGFVVDSSTGEVVDTIYTASKYDGLRRCENCDRIHYSPINGYRFTAVDEVAEQIKQFKLSPTWRKTYMYLKFQSANSRKNEKRLLEVYMLSMNVLNRIVDVGKVGADLAEKVVRDVCSSNPIDRPDILSSAAIYTVANLLGVPVDMNVIARELGLSSIDIGKALKIAMKLSEIYKCNRVEAVIKLIDRAANELKHPQLSTVAKILFNKCSNILSGKKSRVVAGGLLYISSLLTGTSVYGKSISKTVGASLTNVYPMSKKIAAELGIAIIKSKAYVVTSMLVPHNLCKELESAGIKIASYVTCV